jgi:hypothetical protein
MTLLTVLPRLRTNNLKGLGATLTVYGCLRSFQIHGDRPRCFARCDEFEKARVFFRCPLSKGRRHF